ncbi:hypothetical protein CCR75_000963 [Bremia lactucae]|uniref:Uncharacterized protein n=1 Tax=Bremia lactucae TaxID=4779 RepID=A0A976FLZ5_BRELC|nr:hypothetical protein CCR75_000963 [Bremia lactucae]
MTSVASSVSGLRQQVEEIPSISASNCSTFNTRSVLVAVEKSLLRTLAFILYQLDRKCAKYCASSIVQFYFQVQTQLPNAVADSLERVTNSVVSLSDAHFVEFWESLVAKELDEASKQQQLRCQSHLLPYRCVEYSATITPAIDTYDTPEQHVISRLYQHLVVGIQRIFFTPKPFEGRTQTPCTSPVDILDASCRQPQYSSWYQLEKSGCKSNHADKTDEIEPGWAVEYMEQDTNISSEMCRRMAEMMHSTVPSNLFRATVTVNGCDDGNLDLNVDAVTPGSFPPTPITRDLQTRRINHYTMTVLDHATLTLRLLCEENYR